MDIVSEDDLYALAVVILYLLGFGVLCYQTWEERKKRQNRRLAVCLLLEHDGKYLAIDRFKKSGIPGDMGMPGGKVDPGETLLDALHREVLEETGLSIVGQPTLLFSSFDGEYETYTFTGVISLDCVAGLVLSSDEGEVSWVEPQELVSEKCTFAYYNRELFMSIGVKL